VSLLLKFGVNPDALVPVSNDSALQLAIAGGYEDTVEVLKENGASPSTLNLDIIEQRASRRSVNPTLFETSRSRFECKN
jgi:hypothetical protein